MARKKATPKKVVYLWGAGATHAEAQRLGSAISLLMRDTELFGEGITSRIIRRTGKTAVSSFGLEQGVDIEKLISLLTASGHEGHLKLAARMRENYFVELKNSFVKAKLLDGPELATWLLRMHRDSTFRGEVEQLCGMITTNHDGLLQVASQRVYGGIDPGFEFDSETFDPAPSTEVPPVLQLHGSFTWQFGLPIKIEKLSRQSPYEDTVWIPPTILKESKTYPYNKLSGRAYELLSRQCDVLRIVGNSLTQNDWNILSLIFNAQRHREVAKGEAFPIELIMPREAGDGVKRECAYLKKLTTIGYLSEGHFSEYKDYSVDISPDSDMTNPFAYWLKEKMNFHTSKGELDSAERGDLVGPITGAAA